MDPKQWAAGLDPLTPVLITAPMEQDRTVVTTYKPGDAIEPSWLRPNRYRA
ncbi:hypothetical protein [Spirosoma fluminis]